MDINTSLELHDRQGDFVECDKRFTAFIGGIGSGKTYAGVIKALQHARPGTLGAVLAPTYRMLADATLRTFIEVMESLHIPYLYLKSDKMMVLANGAEIIFRSTENPQHLRGPNLHWVHIDEGALCDDKTWDIMLGRLRADHKAWPMWVTTTPHGKANWLYQKIEQLTYFRTATWQNPYLDPEFIASLKAAYTGEFAQQELEGLFVSFEGLVYSEFDKMTHLYDKARIKKYVMGVDEGFTNPCAAIVVGLDNDDRAYIVEEFYQRRVLQSQFVPIVKDLYKKYGVSLVHADPSAAGLIAEMSNAGIPVQGADNAVSDGIQKVKARLAKQEDGKPRLFVNRSCVNTMAEFESYCWKKDKPKDEPEKQNDHAMDALRYAIMGAGRGHGIYV